MDPGCVKAEDLGLLKTGHSVSHVLTHSRARHYVLRPST